MNTDSQPSVCEPEIAIRVENVSKKYRLYDTPKHRLKEALHPFRRKYHNDFWALRDISFDVKRGETVGVIGRNGSGKSTLLQIVCGILQATDGEIKVSGRTSALLELGAGFNPEFTGKQNVYMNGALVGANRAEMDSRFEAISTFADIGEFIDQPVKTYSSGMYVRLAFAVAIHMDPEILIVDEALSVGDMFFQAKCMARMKKMMDNGVTLIFVSHDLRSVKSLCSRCLWLQDGKVRKYADADSVAVEYTRSLVENINVQSSTKATLDIDKSSLTGRFVNDSFSDDSKYFRSGTGAARFLGLDVLNSAGYPLNNLAEFDEEIILRTYIEFYNDCEYIAVAYHIRDKHRQEIIGNDSLSANTDIYSRKFKVGDRLSVSFKFSLPLMHGTYSVNLLISSFTDNKGFRDVVFLDWVENTYIFEMKIREPVPLFNFVQIPNQVEYEVV